MRLSDRMRPDAKILIVEDEAIVALEIQDRLEQLGYRVVGTVARGEEALLRISETHPNLVLMDIQLQGNMDGVETAEQIQEKFDIPVIYLTAYTDEETLNRAKITNPFGYLIKPFGEREIYSTVEMALAKHRMEKRLKANEQWWATTLKSIGDAVITTDAKGSISFLNTAAESLLGVDFSEAEGKDLYRVCQFLHSDDRSELSNPVQKVLRSKAILNYRDSAILVVEDGTEKSVLITASPIQDNRNLFTGVALVVRDVSERKQFEERIRLQASALNAAANGIVITDKSGVIQWVNPALSALTGYSAEEVVGKTPALFNSGRHEEAFYGNIWETILSGKVWHDEIVNAKKDGSEYIEEQIITPVYDRNGEISHFVAIKQDITERKEAELAVRESERNFREIFEHIQSGFIRVDTNGRVLLVNPQLLEMMGLDSTETLYGHEVRHLEYLQKFDFQKFARLLQAQGEVRQFQGILVSADGREIQVSVNAYAVQNESGEVECYEGTMADITELKAIESDLKRSRDQLREFGKHQQEILEEERKKIARYIHDELGQDLTALKMDVAWMKRKLPESGEGLLQKAEAMSGLIDESIQHVKHVSAELRPRLLDDLGLIPAIEWQAQAFQERSGVHCTVTARPEEFTLDIDRSITVVRIIQEALTNVARHAEASEVFIELEYSSEALTFTVRDDGKGLRNEEVNKGHSFGLIGVRERALAWGGEVGLEGRPEQGTRLTVLIPLDTTHADTARNNGADGVPAGTLSHSVNTRDEVSDNGQ